MNIDTQPRQKRKTSDSSCYLCQTEMFPCDEQSPCSRCIEKNRPQMCVYTKPKPPTITKYNINHDIPSQIRGNPFLNQIHHQHIQQPLINNNNNNPNNNIHNNNNNNLHQQPQQSNFLNEIIKSNSYDNQQSVQLAHFLISELKDLKDGQKKIYEEVVSLKNRNEKLEEINESLVRKLSLLTTNDSPIVPGRVMNNSVSSSSSSSDINVDNALSYPRNLPEIIDYYQNIFVVFDLLKIPPTIVNASHSFCKLLGYTQQEMIGVPWTQIIHPNRIESTMNIFTTNQKNLVKGSVIEMPQVYKHKNGSIFSTTDNHTIIFDGDGRAICDIVLIKLKSNYNLTNHDLVSKNSYLLLGNSNIITDESSPPSTPQTSSKIEESPPTPTPINNNYNNNNINNNNNNNSFSEIQNNNINYQFNNNSLNNHNNNNINNNNTNNINNNQFNNNNSLNNNNTNSEFYQFIDNISPNPIGLNHSVNSGMYHEFYNPLGVDENMPTWDFDVDLASQIQNNSSPNNNNNSNNNKPK